MKSLFPVFVILVVSVLLIPYFCQSASRNLEDGTLTNSNGISWRNAYWHAVNTSSEEFVTAKGKKERALKDFLENDVVIAEGDIRFNSLGVLVMAHDFEYANEENRPTFREWFTQIVKNTKRFNPETNFGSAKKGMKLDIKENSSSEFRDRFGLASDAVIAEIQSIIEDDPEISEDDVFEGRIVIANADIVLGPGRRGEEGNLRAKLNVEDMKKWRTAFPGIRISIGYEEDSSKTGYLPEMTSEQLGNAIKLGGHIDFNLRAPRTEASLNLVREKVRLALEHSRVKSITVSPWNWPSKGDPEVTENVISLFQEKILPSLENRFGKEAHVLLDLRLE